MVVLILKLIVAVNLMLLITVTPVGNTTTQRGSSSLVPRPWSILGSEQYSFQTINHECSSSNSRFYKGRIFSSKKELKRELSLMALKQHFEFRIRRSSKARFQATCKDDNCSFRVHVKKMDEGEYWQIRKIDKEHSCTIEGFQGRFLQANSSVIGELVSPKLRVNGTALKPKEIMTEMQDHAKSIVFGPTAESFQRIPSNLYMLERTNPGSVTDFELDDDGRFKFCFFSYGACIHGFRSSIRPVIAIDGTHLKGRFHGILFVAACSDGNEQVYPLAFGIGHKENRESWTWFLRRFRKCIDCPTDCMFISDQHKGIKKVMRIVYLDAPHGLCVFHLTMNLKNTFKREDVTGIFKRAYKIYRESEFNEEMSELMRVHPNAYNDLMRIGPAR
ncbi:hypothetical protein Dsin_004982 [Dipteronia sinensis]|uniref:MULE transposase domain-containing protein n=1 Tax=Dipteronia sinensis TaxID=43782 RepID=A0AAE0AWL3_9ROSI|nr:hypothetical protein Dsin_004982 [Dipteronia sinensis]